MAGWCLCHLFCGDHEFSKKSDCPMRIQMSGYIDVAGSVGGKPLGEGPKNKQGAKYLLDCLASVKSADWCLLVNQPVGMIIST